MFGRTPKVDAVKLQEAKLDVLDALLTADPKTEEYTTLLEQLARISELEGKSKDFTLIPDANTMLIVAGTLMQVLIIVGYEHAHPLTSKATDFVQKLKT